MRASCTAPRRRVTTLRVDCWITETRDTMGRSTGYTYAKDGSTQHPVTTGYGSDGRIATVGFLHGSAEKQFNYEYLPGTQQLTLPSNMTLTQEYEPPRDLRASAAYRRGNTLNQYTLLLANDIIGSSLPIQSDRPFCWA